MKCWPPVGGIRLLVPVRREALRASQQDYGSQDSGPLYRYRCAAPRTGVCLYDESEISEGEITSAPPTLVKTGGEDRWEIMPRMWSASFSS